MKDLNIQAGLKFFVDITSTNDSKTEQTKIYRNDTTTNSLEILGGDWPGSDVKDKWSAWMTGIQANKLTTCAFWHAEPLDQILGMFEKTKKYKAEMNKALVDYFDSLKGCTDPVATN